MAAALGLAALRSPTVLWAQVATTTALTVLLVATVGAMVGRRRTFWVGFTAFGWSYWFLSQGPWCVFEVRPWLLSTGLLNVAFDRTHAHAAELRGPNRHPGLRLSEPRDEEGERFATDWAHHRPYVRFQRIGHALGAILHGLFGGMVAAFLRRREDS